MKFLMIPREKIKVEGYRIRFKSGLLDIDDLVHSIGEHGLLCPIAVTKEGETYRLIAGERRLYAMEKLGWDKIPAIDSKSGGGADVLVKGLVENMVRLDLSPLERALAIKEIIEKYGYTQERLSEELDIDRTTISHLLRMLDILHLKVLKYVHESKITFGHTRILMRLKDRRKQLEIADRIIKDQLTIADTALIVDRARPLEELTPLGMELNAIEEDLEKLEEKDRKKIKIRQGMKKEWLEINFDRRVGLKKLLLRIAAVL